ncbi:peptidase G2 autoproteolytic cleavage domain-containing protein [Lysinibacillus sp. NPDC048646]|uniref:peptidase G2 autoproteolytic cleavage domain-containing protein n=1 Tax=Lysinibacillus sp. NPDC048646 TaxID=3390574 RepID=UPI003CFCF9DF
MARMRTIGISLDKGYRDDLNYNFGLLEALIGEANELTDALREEMLGQINNLQQQIDMLTGENIGELLARLNDSIQQALTAAQDARMATSATEQATALTITATELAKASATLAEEKANYAEGKAILAQEAADNANQEASNLSQLKIDVVQATQHANTATGNANQATQAAQTATNAINVVLPNVTGLVNLKEWTIDTQYKKNNFVTLEGNGYMALRDNKGVRPPSLPVLSNADWAMFVQKGEKGEQGTGVRILGTLGDESALPPTGEPGDAYLINGDLYVWSETTNDWTNVGTIKGPKGDTGPQGPEGPQGPPGQDADLTEVNQEIANLQQEVTDNKSEVTAHLAEIATVDNLGHIKPDGITILVDPLTGVASSSGGNGDIYQDGVIRGEKSNAIGSYTFADSAVFATVVTGVNPTQKSLSLLSSTGNGLSIGDSVKLKKEETGILFDATINAINGDIVTLNEAFELNPRISHVITLGGTNTNQTAIGHSTVATGSYSVALGHKSTSTGMYSYSDGWMNVASGTVSAARGANTKATGNTAITEGYGSHASATYSKAMGYFTTANVYAAVVMGYFNKQLTGSPYSSSVTADLFVIGNGANLNSKSNAFRVTADGKTYGLSSFNSAGADYAEYFEWIDGNFDVEDRVGYVVSLEGSKIRKSKNTDDFILGIISSNPSVIGDSYQDSWQGMYHTDEWDRIKYEWVNKPYEEVGEDGNITSINRPTYCPVINPDFDPDDIYIPREQRKEWSAVGLIGKLLVRDDGTCIINSYAKVSSVDGEVTASTEITNMRVIERVNPNIIRVFIK